MKHQADKIDISNVVSDYMDLDRYDEKILSVASKAIMKALESDDTYACLPIEFNYGDDPNDGIGGRPVDDPLTIYIRIPLGEDIIEPVTFSFSLVDCVNELIDGGKDGFGKICDENKEPVRMLRDALIAEANKLDSYLGD